MTYQNGDVRLAGVLLMPTEDGEYPGAVVLHGSGTSDRSNGRKDRLGFVGLSQGGHVAPLAASMGDVQFVINMVGGTLSMKDMLFHELERFGPVATESWPSTVDDDYWTFWGLIYDFDPIPYWREVVDVRGIPAFIAYGELDENDNVPVKASVQRLQDELVGEKLTVRVYPDTGHSLMDEALMSEGQHELVGQLLSDLDTWIEQNLLH